MRVSFARPTIIPDAKVLLANYLNIRDLLQYDKLVMPLAVLDVISANFG